MVLQRGWSGSQVQPAAREGMPADRRRVGLPAPRYNTPLLPSMPSAPCASDTDLPTHPPDMEWRATTFQAPTSTAE